MGSAIKQRTQPSCVIFGCGTISCLVSFAEFREMIIFAGCMGTSQEGCSRVKLCKERKFVRLWMPIG